MMNAPLFDIHGLKHAYPGKTVLEVEHLSFFSETITGLTGPNGSGKSTLLNILGLILKPSRGQVAFKGSPVTSFSDKARHRIALLTQEPYLLNRSVFDNVAYGLSVRRDRVDVQKRVFEALEIVGLPPERFARRHAHELSGGEALRVALAARLVLRPDVLLLDEPTSHVDEQSSRMIRNAVLTVRQSLRTTLVISSHDREWLDSICDRVLTLLQGRIYDLGRLNILYGPWKQWTDGLFRGPAPEGVSPLPVPPPPHDQAMAIIPARSLHLAGDERMLPNEALFCSCRVAGLNLEHTSGRVHVSVRNGESLLISAAGSPADQALLIPGAALYAYYFPRDLIFR